MGLRARLASPRKRRDFVLGYAFPPALELGVPDGRRAEVMEALREWFVLCQATGVQPVAPPSRALDAAWRAFIAMPSEYRAFCEGAFGRLLPHGDATPTTLPADVVLARTAGFARRSGLARDGVPSMFTLDARLGLPGATSWTPEAFAALADRSGVPAASGGSRDMGWIPDNGGPGGG